MSKKLQQRRRRLTFRVQAELGSQVFVAGTFNRWNPAGKKLVDKLNNGNFSASILLPVGRHEYKFVINGEWRADGSCQEWATNEHGTLNSVIVVK